MILSTRNNLFFDRQRLKSTKVHEFRSDNDRGYFRREHLRIILFSWL